jgi:ubiquinone/menaquinone biosynthesis C-methylase UbiE/uncharacterized protein YbaR (Trm112 family)
MKNPDSTLSMREIRDAYRRGGNIMDLLRKASGRTENSIPAVLTAYDLQAGSYRRSLREPGYRARKDHNTTIVAKVLDEIGGDTLLDAGVGEATTLVPVLQKVQNTYSLVVGFDLSWSRLAHAREHLTAHQLSNVHLLSADLFRMPFASESFDVVFTSHALEPNHGRESAGLAELARVSRKWVVLFEPSYEHGSSETRESIIRKGYVRGLADAARTAGLEIVRDELAGFVCSPGNETGLLLLRKEESASKSRSNTNWLACPSCKGEITCVKQHYYCRVEGLVFPIIDNLPCLLPEHAILATQFESLDVI